MKKTTLRKILYGIAILLGLAFTFNQAVAATVLFPFQGGTGKGSAVVGDVGKCLSISDDSPFTYTYASCATLAAALTEGSVVFANGAGALAQDNTNFFWDDTNNQLNIGNNINLAELSQYPLVVAGDDPSSIGISVQNKNSGAAAYTDIFASNDADGVLLEGHYIDMGIASSGFVAAATGNVKTVTINAAGTLYTVGDVLTLVGGDSNATVTVDSIDAGGEVLIVSLSANGSGYSVANGLATTGGTGSGATINVTELYDNSIDTANGGYLYVSGGNLTVGTDFASSVIKFHTGGFAGTNEKMRITDSGFVGINTASPDSRLHVVTSTVAGRFVKIGSATSAAGMLTVRGDDNSAAYISLQNLASTATTNHGIGTRYFFGTNASATPITAGRIDVIKERQWTSTASTQDSAITFYTTLDGTSAEKMRINSAGLVGINNTNPLFTLHAVQTGAGIQDTIAASNKTAAAANVGAAYVIQGVSDTTIASMRAAWEGAASTDGFIAFYTRGSNSNTEKVRISSSGLVGINTTSAASKLDILGTSTFGASGVSSFTSRAHTVTLSGADPTTYATMYAAQIGTMTLVGTNANQTVTNAAGLTVAPPIKSTNVAVTTTQGLFIPATAVSTATNAYGIYVNAPSGATNNYSAAFANLTGPALRLSTGSAINGLFIGSADSNEAIFGFGVDWNQSGGAITSYIARETTGAVMQSDNGTISFYSDTGLVADSTFTPTLRLSITTAGRLGIGVTNPSYLVSLNNSAAHQIGIENSATDVVGRALTVAAGSTVAGTAVSDVAGGNLLLESGIGTGTGASSIIFRTATTLTTGMTAQSMSTKMTLLGNGNLGIGQTTPTAVLHLKAGTTTASTAPLKFASGNLLTVAEAGAVEFLTNDFYGTVTTNAVRHKFVASATGRATAQTAANASVQTYTLGATDNSFEVSANVLVTTSSAENFTVTVAYTDEGNTARTMTLNFTIPAGTTGTAIAAANGAVPYAGIPVHIRVKASTTITIATTGTFTGATYNVEGIIKRI